MFSRLQSNKSPTRAFKWPNGLAQARWRGPVPTSSDASFMFSRRQMQLLCVGLVLSLTLCSAWQAVSWGRTQLDTGAMVCADTLRLHIRAESDSIADQSAKLHVRDAVLRYMDAACPAQSKADALVWASRHLFELQLTARHALAELNIRTPVQVQLVNMYFATRRYASGVLPAGRYDALRIEIGAGAGRNWWCVLYPGLCRAACGSYALPEENDLVCGDYILRLKLVEWVQQRTARREDVVLLG